MGQQLHARVGDEDIVLDPDAAPAGKICTQFMSAVHEPVIHVGKTTAATSRAPFTFFMRLT